MNWSTVIFIILCRYFTQSLLMLIDLFTPVKSYDSAFIFRFLENPYLSNKEKVVVANSKVGSVEAESSRLRKDLIEAMDQVTKAKEKLKELKDALKVKKKLVIQKDEEVQTALLKIDEEREKVITKFLESDRFSNL